MVPLIVALWLAQAAAAAWSTVAFVIATLSAFTLGVYMLVGAMTGSATIQPGLKTTN